MVCVTVVTGSNLKKRIEASMNHRVAHRLNLEKNLLRATTRMACIALPFLISVIQIPQTQAQSEPAKRLEFEVASVKPSKSARLSEGMTSQPGGRLTATSVPVFMIIAAAYQVAVHSPRLSGGPDWIRLEGFDIAATAENSVITSDLPKAVQDARMRSMLQSLLADRFKLVIRRETKEIPVYALVASKNGAKLQKANVEESSCSQFPRIGVAPCHRLGGGQARGINGQAVSLADLVTYVENWTDRPVIDKTGIDGLFDIKTEGWVPLRGRPEGGGENGEGVPDPRPSLFVVFDRLGLKLETQKAPVEVFVIEHIERPTEN